VCLPFILIVLSITFRSSPSFDSLCAHSILSSYLQIGTAGVRALVILDRQSSNSSHLRSIKAHLAVGGIGMDKRNAFMHCSVTMAPLEASWSENERLFARQGVAIGKRPGYCCDRQIITVKNYKVLSSCQYHGIETLFYYNCIY